MKRRFSCIAVMLLLLCMLPVQALGARELMPVGQVIGLELRDGKVIVAALDEDLGGPAKAAGLETGDVIEKINGTAIQSGSDIKKALETSDGSVLVQFNRGGKTQEIRIKPKITRDGPKLGIYLRQGITGIGTVTWYDPATGDFGTLGHGVNNSAGKLLSLHEGNAYEARIISVRKGQAGQPGQLIGAVERRVPIGELTKNTTQGLFGNTKEGWETELYPVATMSEIRTGEAKIRSMVSGTTVQEYSVEILKIYPNSGERTKNLLLKVTDPALLETTGGIVQGMSGSPIIQDGKLVGAVTHVLVNDPTTGYGIFIENMLDAAA